MIPPGDAGSEQAEPRPSRLALMGGSIRVYSSRATAAIPVLARAVDRAGLLREIVKTTRPD